MSLSSKSLRILNYFGVQDAFARGAVLLPVGPTYELLKDPGTHVRLVFLHDDEGRLCVGYARRDDGQWSAVESEPFSLRALGYYQRRLKRLGEFVDTDDRRRRR